MRIAVLGATGYLGSLLVKRLLDNGHNVIALFRNEKKLACFDGYRCDRLEFCHTETDKFEALAASGERVDFFINLACSYETPQNTVRDIINSNLTVPLAFLGSCAIAGIGCYITAGTGLPANFNTYTTAKDHLRSLGKYMSAHSSTKFVNLSIENFYGPGEPVNRFLPWCIRRLRTNEPVPLTLGTQKRDFIHADDIISFIFHLLGIVDTLPEYISIPLGTGSAPQIREVISFVADELNSESDLLFGAVPMRPNEPDSVADTNLLESLGYTIRYDWKTGIRSLLG